MKIYVWHVVINKTIKTESLELFIYIIFMTYRSANIQLLLEIYE